MAKADERKSGGESEKRHTDRRSKERPEREPDPDTLEGPGGRHDEDANSDERDNVTRRGER